MYIYIYVHVYIPNSWITFNFHISCLFFMHFLLWPFRFVSFCPVVRTKSCCGGRNWPRSWRNARAARRWLVTWTMNVRENMQLWPTNYSDDIYLIGGLEHFLLYPLISNFLTFNNVFLVKIGLGPGAGLIPSIKQTCFSRCFFKPLQKNQPTNGKRTHKWAGPTNNCVYVFIVI